MRYRIKDYKITVSEGLVYVHIAVPDGNEWLVINPVKEAIRLIVDETAKIVFCSSMQKDRIASMTASSESGFDWAIAFAIPQDKNVTANDLFTIEVDWGDEPLRASDISESLKPVTQRLDEMMNILEKSESVQYATNEDIDNIINPPTETA